MNALMRCVVAIAIALLAPAALLAQVPGTGPINPPSRTYLSNSTASPGVTLTTGVAADVVTLPITPGDWQVCITVYFLPAATTVAQMVDGSISATLNTRNAAVGAFAQNGSGVANSGQANLTTFVCDRVNITVGATYRAVALATFTTSTLSAYGKIQARRIR